MYKPYFKESLSKSELIKMAKAIMKTGTEPEFLFAPEDDDPKEQEKWIQDTTKNKKFSYDKDIDDLFSVYNQMWMDSF